MGAKAGGAANILIVEDDPLFRQSLETLLTEFGYVTHSAESAEEALLRARSEAFDLLICDVRISGTLDGVDALASVRTVQPSVRCIIMTGFSDVDAPLRAAKLQADDYLLKPFKMQALLHSVQSVLQFEPAAPGLFTRLAAVPARALRWFHDASLQNVEDAREKAMRQFYVLVRSRRLRCSEAHAFFSAWEELELEPQRPAMLTAYQRWARSLLEMQIPESCSPHISRSSFERLYGRIQADVLDVTHLLKAVRLLHAPETHKQSLDDFCAYHWLWAPSAEQGDPFMGLTLKGYRLVRQHSGGDSPTRLYEALAEVLPDAGDRILCLPASAESEPCIQSELSAGRARLLASEQGHHFLLYPSYAMSLKARLPAAGVAAADAWQLLRPVFLQVEDFHRRGQVSGCFSLRDIDWPPDEPCRLTRFSDADYRQVHQIVQTSGPSTEFPAAPEVLVQAHPSPASDQAVLGRLLFETVHGGRYPDPALRVHIRLLGQPESNQAFAPHVERLRPLVQVFYRLAVSDPHRRFPDIRAAVAAADSAFAAR